MTAPQPTQYNQGQGTVSADQLNTFQQTCSNVAQLRTVIGLPGMQMFTQGTTTPGDGGARPYYWNSTSVGPDNGTTVIVPQSGVSGAWIAMVLAQTTIVTQFSFATGTSTAITAVFSPPILVLEPGNIFWLGVSITNTGPINLNVGTGFLEIGSTDGNSLQGGEITPGLIGVVVNTAANGFSLFVPNGAVPVGSAVASEQAPQWQQVLAGNNIIYTGYPSGRMLGATYTNTTGRPIYVLVTMTSTALFSAFFTVDGVNLFYAPQNAATQFSTAGAIVPNGATYLANVNAGTGSIITWQEL